jgi:hypothetical protein
MRETIKKKSVVALAKISIPTTEPLFEALKDEI